jgi:hypothetical protein
VVVGFVEIDNVGFCAGVGKKYVMCKGGGVRIGLEGWIGGYKIDYREVYVRCFAFSLADDRVIVSYY